MTILDMVQSVLNDMDSDFANDINATSESQQVTSIIKDAYYKMVTSRDNWPFLGTLTTLEGLGDTTNPTKMRIPDGMSNIGWIKYNKSDVAYMKPKDFKDLIDKRVAVTGTIDANGYALNRNPVYWTSYDDNFVVMDGYNTAVDTTLQGSKSAIFGYINPTWQVSNNFIPLLPDKFFPILLADAKGTAFLALKQQANAKEESFATKGKDRMTAIGRRVVASESKTNDAVNFGRK